MQSIGTNEQVINYLKGDYSLLDGEVLSFKVYSTNGIVNIDIDFQLIRSKAKILLKFKDVVEYSFYHNYTHYFYYVETPPKLFKKDDGFFYLSLDPNEIVEGISEDDNDMILSKEIEGFIELSEENS